MRNITKDEVAFLMQHHEDYTKFRRGHVVNFSDEVLDVVEKISKEVYNIPMSRSCGSCVADAMRNVFNLAREENEKEAKETVKANLGVEIKDVSEAEDTDVTTITIPAETLKAGDVINLVAEVSTEATKEPISDVKTEESTEGKPKKKTTPKKG